ALPRDELARLAAQAFRTLPVETFGYGDAAGYRPLRVELAAHLHTTRGVACTPDQIVLTSGAQQAIWLCAHVLANAGDAVWLEDPGYRGARTTFERSQLRLIPVPVDEKGIDVDAGLAAAPRARLAYVTPSHQYPMGVPLAVSRRLQLLDWAEQTKAWIIEDDYDSEYRYGAPLLPSLFSLDGGRRVLYIGSLSKVLAPALRLGYLVVPAALAGPIRDAKAVLDRQGPTIMQAVLAQFMESGGYSRHLNRMRRIGNRRWQVMMDGLLPLANAGLLHVAGSPAGLHHTVQYRPGVDDRMVHDQARRHGLYLPPLSGYGIVNRPGGSVLGFAAYPDANLRAGLATLQTILEKQAGT
ncbi:MAG: PLP-dependent aminotransferase family protein, partial [Bacteroidota bacterium]